MTRAEQAAKEIYKDGIQLVGRRDRNNNIVIHPETMVGVLRNAAQQGYERAEKDIIERACVWLFDNFYNYDKALRHSIEYDFRKAMEEE